MNYGRGLLVVRVRVVHDFPLVRDEVVVVRSDFVFREKIDQALHLEVRDVPSDHRAPAKEIQMPGLVSDVHLGHGVYDVRGF